MEREKNPVEGYLVPSEKIIGNACRWHTPKRKKHFPISVPLLLWDLFPMLEGKNGVLEGKSGALSLYFILAD